MRRINRKRGLIAALAPLLLLSGADLRLAGTIEWQGLITPAAARRRDGDGERRDERRAERREERRAERREERREERRDNTQANSPDQENEESGAQDAQPASASASAPPAQTAGTNHGTRERGRVAAAPIPEVLKKRKLGWKLARFGGDDSGAGRIANDMAAKTDPIITGAAAGSSKAKRKPVTKKTLNVGDIFGLKGRPKATKTTRPTLVEWYSGLKRDGKAKPAKTARKARGKKPAIVAAASVRRAKKARVSEPAGVRRANEAFKARFYSPDPAMAVLRAYVLDTAAFESARNRLLEVSAEFALVRGQAFIGDAWPFALSTLKVGSTVDDAGQQEREIAEIAALAATRARLADAEENLAVKAMRVNFDALCAVAGLSAEAQPSSLAESATMSTSFAAKLDVVEPLDMKTPPIRFADLVVPEMRSAFAGGPRKRDRLATGGNIAAQMRLSILFR